MSEQQLRAAIEDILLKTGKHNQDECSEIADAIINDLPKEEEQGTAHIRKETVDEEWELFWKPIVCKEDGTINIEQVKKELHDFSYLMEQIPKVYCHITGSRMSKVFYPAETVISVSDDYQQEVIEQAVKDELGEREAPVAGREEDAVEFAEWAGWDWRRVEGKSMWENQKTLEILSTSKLHEKYKTETGR